MIKKKLWEIWIKDKKQCRKYFNFYLKKGIIKKEKETEHLNKSHLNKTDYNLNFINHLLNEKRFYEWIIIGCYYAVYHASLSLLAIKGFSSKSHLATLCSLILFYYEDKKLTKEDIELMVKSSIEKQEISYFVEAKSKRETASYGFEKFNESEALELRYKTISFVNKVKMILEERN